VKKLKTNYIVGRKYWEGPDGQNAPENYLDREFRKKYSDPIIEAIEKKFKKEDSFTVHEFGCGWGTLLLAVHEHFPNAIISANDVWESAISFIKKERGFIDISKSDTFDFIESCIDKNKKFDFVFSNAHFIHLPDKRLRELSKISEICEYAYFQEAISNIHEDFNETMKHDTKNTGLPDSNYGCFLEKR
jgi:methylase of polypeptide subunit release factors